MRFRNRADAGGRLAGLVAELAVRDPLVLALPRGGVPVAAPVAHALAASLDVFIARKVGAPGHREFGIGAIAEGGETVADERALSLLGVTRARFAELAAAEMPELERRIRRYRGERPLPDLSACDVIVVDDGLATGVTAEAAVRALRRSASRIILAVPVSASAAVERLRPLVDHLACVITSADFVAVGQWYDDFTQTTDEEVVRLLRPAPPTAVDDD